MPDEKLLALDGFTVVGVAARTTNRAETDPAVAKIPGLWQRFFSEQEQIPGRLDPDVVYGVYTAYDSDHTGEYSLIVGAESAPRRSCRKGSYPWRFLQAGIWSSPRRATCPRR
jgi:predicted transcriptional regulator YdeE